LGKSVTPWLLNRVKELSDGKSVDASGSHLLSPCLAEKNNKSSS
jgi:pseudouridine-5'-phosphate glycosidase